MKLGWGSKKDNFIFFFHVFQKTKKNILPTIICIYRAIVGNSFLSFFNKIQLLDFQGHLEENVPGVYV